MGLLLCSKKAEHPFYYEKLDISLWSLQELCYVLYHYPVIIPDDFVDKKLTSWLRDELSMGLLAAKLEQYMGIKEEQKKLIIRILRDGNYYTLSEISAFADELLKLTDMDDATHAERVGDTFFRLGKYGRAVNAYREAADLKGPSDVACRMKLADAYVTVMQYRKASDTYEEIFVETNQDTPLRKLYFIQKLEPSINTISKYVDTIDTDKLATWELEYDTVSQKVENSEEAERVTTMYHKDKQDFRDEAEKLLVQWKMEYRSKV